MCEFVCVLHAFTRCVFVCIQGGSYQDARRREDQEAIRRLREQVKERSQEAEALRTQIDLLSRQGGHVLPPLPTPSRGSHARKEGPSVCRVGGDVLPPLPTPSRGSHTRRK